LQTTLARSFVRETTALSFFGRLQHGSTSRRPSSQPSHFLQRFIFCEFPTVLSKYSLLWERIVFCFHVVSSFVCVNLILQWTITHSFLFLCSIFFCMYSFDDFSSSLVDSSLQHAFDLFRVLCPCQFLEGDTEG